MLKSDGTNVISPALAAALDTYREFLLSDDVERSGLIEAADQAKLTGLADAVDPLFDEINAVLDRFDAAVRPMPADQEQLESALHSFAQAGMEAKMEVDR